mgnify:CR=1 FL=1
MVTIKNTVLSVLTQKIKKLTKDQTSRGSTMQIEYLKVEDLTFLDENPRIIKKDQFEKLKKSMKEDPKFLEMRPILINKTPTGLVIYAGNQRVRAAIEIGLEEIPCIVQEDLPRALMLKRSIKDNKTYGDFNLDILANEWDEELLLECGFTETDLCFQDKQEKEKKQKFNIILEFESQNDLNDTMMYINQNNRFFPCQVKVKV